MPTGQNPVQPMTQATKYYKSLSLLFSPPYLPRERLVASSSTPCNLVALKITQKYTLSHKNFAKIHCFKRILKGILPHDTLSHNFLINCNTLSSNSYQNRTPCRIIFTVKGHPVERHIPSSKVWEYPPPTWWHPIALSGDQLACGLLPNKSTYFHSISAALCSIGFGAKLWNLLEFIELSVLISRNSKTTFLLVQLRSHFPHFQ